MFSHSFTLDSLASKKNTPTKLSEGTSYVARRNKIEIWKRVTSLEKEEQGFVALLDSPEGNSNAEKAAANFNDTDLFCADGLQVGGNQEFCASYTYPKGMRGMCDVTLYQGVQ